MNLVANIAIDILECLGHFQATIYLESYKLFAIVSKIKRLQPISATPFSVTPGLHVTNAFGIGEAQFSC